MLSLSNFLIFLNQEKTILVVRDPRLRVNDPRTLRQYAPGIHGAVSGIDGEWTSRKQLASAAIRRHTVSQLKNVF
jgi:hypothetical protein